MILEIWDGEIGSAGSAHSVMQPGLPLVVTDWTTCPHTLILNGVPLNQVNESRHGGMYSIYALTYLAGTAGEWC